MWAGTQVTRFKVGGGLLRRFLLVNWTPTRREQKLLKRAFRRGTNLHLDPQILKDYRSDVVDFISNIQKINEISFSENLVDSMEEVTHHTEAVLRKYALGYNLLTQPIESEFVVDLDPKLGLFLDRAEEWRKTLIGDPEADMIINVIQENGGQMKWADLKIKLIDFSMRFDATDFIVRRLMNSKSLIYANGMLYLPSIWNSRRRGGGYVPRKR